MLCVAVAVLLFFSRVLCCQEESFKNAYVLAYVDESDMVGKELTVNGCFSRTPELCNYKRIECTNQKIRKLFKGAATNLSTDVMIFSSIRLEEIEPGAFDLPRVTQLDLSKNKIVEIKRGVFGPLITLATLHLDNNKITRIEGGAFANIINLKELFLQDNMINMWDLTWFRNNIHLERIHVNNNFINFLPSGAVKEASKVKEIHLRNNRLTDIHPKALLGVRELYTLDLSENYIKKLPEDLFSLPGFDVQNLYLHKNNLTYIPQTMMNKLSMHSGIFYINLHSNPWQCACYTKIEQWVKKLRGGIDVFNIGCYNKSNPICVILEKNPKACVEEVDEEIYSIYYAVYKDATRKDFSDRDVTCF